MSDERWKLSDEKGLPKQALRNKLSKNIIIPITICNIKILCAPR